MRLEIGQLVRSNRAQGPLMANSIGEFKGMDSLEFFVVEFIYGTFILPREDFSLFEGKDHLLKVDHRLLMPDGFEINQGDYVSMVGPHEKTFAVDAKNGKRYFLMMNEITGQQKNKYLRAVPSTNIDVYDVLKAWNVTNPAVQHAIKKLLQPGQRGAKSLVQDLEEAAASIKRAIELEAGK